MEPPPKIRALCFGIALHIKTTLYFITRVRCEPVWIKRPQTGGLRLSLSVIDSSDQIFLN